MKQIIIDIETYNAELQKAFEAGVFARRDFFIDLELLLSELASTKEDVGLIEKFFAKYEQSFELKILEQDK